MFPTSYVIKYKSHYNNELSSEQYIYDRSFKYYYNIFKKSKSNKSFMITQYDDFHKKNLIKVATCSRIFVPTGTGINFGTKAQYNFESYYSIDYPGATYFHPKIFYDYKSMKRYICKEFADKFLIIDNLNNIESAEIIYE